MASSTELSTTSQTSGAGRSDRCCRCTCRAASGPVRGLRGPACPRPRRCYFPSPRRALSTGSDLEVLPWGLSREFAGQPTGSRWHPVYQRGVTSKARSRPRNGGRPRRVLRTRTADVDSGDDARRPSSSAKRCSEARLLVPESGRPARFVDDHEQASTVERTGSAWAAVRRHRPAAAQSAKTVRTASGTRAFRALGSDVVERRRRPACGSSGRRRIASLGPPAPSSTAAARDRARPRRQAGGRREHGLRRQAGVRNSASLATASSSENTSSSSSTGGVPVSAVRPGARRGAARARANAARPARRACGPGDRRCARRSSSRWGPTSRDTAAEVVAPRRARAPRPDPSPRHADS